MSWIQSLVMIHLWKLPWWVFISSATKFNVSYCRPRHWLLLEERIDDRKKKMAKRNARRLCLE
jgi:hypothetical protein